MKKPKVLFFLHLPPPIHGVTITNSRIIESALIQKDLCVKILPISYNQEITSIGQPGFKKILKTIQLLIQLTKILITFRPQLVYFSIVPTGIYFYRDAVFVFLIKLFGRKILLHLHGIGIDQSIRGTFSRWIYLTTFKNHYTILQSESLRKDISKIRNVIRKIFIVHNAIPFTQTAFPKATAQNFLTFINISTVIPAKGQMDILKAAQKLIEQNINSFQIILVGQVFDRDYDVQLKTFIAKHSLEKYIYFKGALFNEEKIRELEKADIFLFPSYNESFGLVSIEAMRAGLPVIATHVGSLSEIIGPGCGFLYSPGDIEALAQHMLYFIKNRGAVAPMGKKAFEVFTRKFTFEIFEQKMHQVFLDVLQSTKPNISRQPRG